MLKNITNEAFSRNVNPRKPDRVCSCNQQELSIKSVPTADTSFRLQRLILNTLFLVLCHVNLPTFSAHLS